MATNLVVTVTPPEVKVMSKVPVAVAHTYAAAPLLTVAVCAPALHKVTPASGFVAETLTPSGTVTVTRFAGVVVGVNVIMLVNVPGVTTPVETVFLPVDEVSATVPLDGTVLTGNVARVHEVLEQAVAPAPLATDIVVTAPLVV